MASVAKGWIRGTWQGRSSQVAHGSYWALKDVSFELQGGRSLALLGPNGAGKSTILKLLARITQPTSGNLEVRGRLAALIELGAGFHADLTGRENIYLNGVFLGLRRREIDARFDEIVAFSELEPFIDTPIKRYSSGMTVRLGFAVASCLQPEILLVDEVLAVGDASFRQKCVQRIKALLGAGTSMIFVSHDMGLVKAVCDTAIYVEGGVIQQTGAVSDVIDTYNAALDRRRAECLQSQVDDPVAAHGGVEIAGVQVLDEAGRIGKLFGDRPAEVRVQYVAYRPLARAQMVVRVLRSDGVSCCVVRTLEDGNPLTLDVGPGMISVVLEPLQLFAGTYYAVVWVTDADGASGLARANSDWFEVKNRMAGLNAGDAVFEPVRRWVHRSAAGQ